MQEWAEDEGSAQGKGPIGDDREADDEDSETDVDDGKG